MALNENALTDFDTVKVWLKIPDAEVTPELQDKIELLINAASASIEQMTERILYKKEHTEFQDGRRNDKTMPYHWPIIEVKELWIDSGQTFDDTNNQLTSNQFDVIDNRQTIQLLENRRFSSGHHNIKIVYDAGYDPIPSDLEQACVLYVEWLYLVNERGDSGRLAKTKGDESTSINQEIPTVVQSLVMPYVRHEFDRLPTAITNG